MSLYTRARKHIDINRVKELREDKIRREKIAEILKQQEIIRAEIAEIEAEESKHVNWRKELKEGMTTSGLGMINLPANEFDVGEADDKNSDVAPSHTPDGTLSNGTWTMNNAPDEGNSGITISLLVDLSRSDTFSTQVYFDNATIDPAHGMDVVLDGPGGQIQIIPISVPASGTGSANPQIAIKPSLRVKGVTLSYTVIGNGGEEGAKEIGTNAIRITSTVPYRTKPMNLFVSLDDPEATAFIRDTLSNQSLSPEEKKKKLEEQLGASSEYLTKMYGEGIFTGATEISDVEPQQSFSDIAVSPTPYGSGTRYGTKPDGSQGFPEPGELNKGNDGKWYEYGPGGWVPIPSVDAGGGDDTMIAAGGNPRNTGGTSSGDPDNIQWPRNKYPNKKAPPGPGYRSPTAKKKQTTMVAHHEPQGKVLSEKKKLKSPKDLVDKIPGYYDGKPAPLGFPIVEPPKMKNGMHPDLIDGKKTAKRFNRLDPISARAMPKTGNPHIDKKVKAAANKPK